jgi:predicted small lipoprotein YifL
MAIVVAAGPGRQPDFLQRFLQIDDQLASVSESDRDHAADALVVDVGIGCIVDAIATALDRSKCGFCAVHVLRVGHYNFAMLNVRQILVSAVGLALVGVGLTACGQKGPLYLPTDPAAKERATLPQVLLPGPVKNDSATKPAQPAAPTNTAPAPTGDTK